MLRSFLPVGQGAFYREVFDLGNEKKTIIYDCGSLPNKSIIEKQIRNEFSKGDVIDAVFISHFDEDHINGLPFLLKHCKVNNLFFPLITDSDKVYLKLKALISTDEYGFLYNLIENPFQTIKDLVPPQYNFSLYQIESEYTQSSNDNNNNSMQIVSSGKNVAGKVGLSGAKEIDWELIPFNFRRKFRIIELQKAICNVFDCQNDQIENKIRELIDFYPNNKDKIKEAYRGVEESFNTNSMTLFSGTKDRYCFQYCALPKVCLRCEFCGDRLKNGCLYLGDYDTSDNDKWTSLKKEYQDYWEYIGCIQIPHHGSVHSYNKEISKLNVLNVISAGHNNRYRHPHSAVIKDLLLNDCIVHIVNEHVGTQLDLVVNCF